MAAIQEMLVSYGVRIDESGIRRLHTLMEESRRKAAGAAKAFADAGKTAEDYMKALLPIARLYPAAMTAQALPEKLPGLTSAAVSPAVSPDTGRQTRELARFATVLSSEMAAVLRPMAAARSHSGTDSSSSGRVRIQPDFSAVSTAAEGLEETLNARAPVIRLTADTGSLLHSAATAAARIKAMFSGIRLELSAAPSGSDPGVLQLSAGGRFDRPTYAHLAEDGDAEYVIPFRKPVRALPLISRMLKEMPVSMVRNLLQEAAPEGVSLPSPAAVSSTLPSTALLTTLSLPATENTVNRSWQVSAPCSITVTGSGTDPLQVGRAVEEAMEQHLVRNLEKLWE